MPNLYLAWKGSDDDDTTLWTIRCSTQVPDFDQPQQVFRTEQTSLGPQQALPVLCSSKPALLALSDRILVAAADDVILPGPGSGHSDNLSSGYCQSWPNLIGTQLVPGTATSWAPALAPWGNGALMVWNGDGSDTRIWCSNYSQSFNVWSSQFLTELENSGQPIQSGSTPAIVNFSGTLLMVWRGEGSNDNLYYATSQDGLHWQGNKGIPGAASTIAPAMTIFNGVPVICFKGGTNDDGIHASVYNAATDSWAPVAQTGGFGTSHGPSLAVYQGELFMAWKGVPGDTSLWCATTSDPLNPKAWSGQKNIPGTGSSVGPAAVVF